jgi:hypothetical protein
MAISFIEERHQNVFRALSLTDEQLPRQDLCPKEVAGRHNALQERRCLDWDFLNVSSVRFRWCPATMSAARLHDKNFIMKDGIAQESSAFVTLAA